MGGAQHLATPIDTLKHVQTLSMRQTKLTNQIDGLTSAHDHMTRDLVAGGERILLLKDEVKLLKEKSPVRVGGVDKNILDRLKHLEDSVLVRDALITSQTTELNEFKRLVERLQSTTDRNTKQLKLTKLTPDTTTTKQGNVTIYSSHYITSPSH